MQEVIADEHILGRRLRGDRFQRRVRIDGRDRGGPAAVGHAEHADLAIIVGQIFDQPVDAVIGVGGFVDAVRFCLERTQVHKLAPRSKPAADVLKDEDIFVFGQFGITACLAEAAFDALFREPIGRPRHQDGELADMALGAPDLRVQADAVAHRNHHILRFISRKTRWRGNGLAGRRLNDRRCPDKNAKQERGQRKPI